MNNTKKFWLGLLAGVMGTLVICFAGILLFQTIYLNWQLGSGVISENNGYNNEQEVSEEETIPGPSEKLDWESVGLKLEFLQELLAAYYLNDFTAEDMENGLYKGLVNSLGDPYTVYYTKEEYEEFAEATSGSYCGIGVQVSQNMSTGIITVVRTFVNGSSYEEGMLPGDIIYKVEDEEVTGIDLNTVVTKIKGEEGTYVNVTVYRESELEYLTFRLQRRQIVVDTVTHEMVADNIGYISIMEFDEVTYDQFVLAMDDLEKQGMEALIVDVRGNGGGLMDQACGILDRLLPEGLIVYTEDKYGEREEHFSSEEESFDKPMVVLVNGTSASASEIFAGAMQDYEAATILGTQTFGKGIVQTLLPLTDGTAIKVTISKYYTPNGTNIHGVGITPDVELDLADELKAKAIVPKEEDNQLQEAIRILQEEIR